MWIPPSFYHGRVTFSTLLAVAKIPPFLNSFIYLLWNLLRTTNWINYSDTHPGQAGKLLMPFFLYENIVTVFIPSREENVHRSTAFWREVSRLADIVLRVHLTANKLINFHTVNRRLNFQAGQSFSTLTQEKGNRIWLCRMNPIKAAEWKVPSCLILSLVLQASET